MNNPWQFIRPLWPALAILFGALLLIELLRVIFGAKRARASAHTGTTFAPLPDVLAYRCTEGLFTPAELAFYKVLRAALRETDLLIFGKVRLGDLVEVPDGIPGAQGMRSRVQSKHADFVICSAGDVRPRLVIELDDSSHQDPDRQERDAIVDRILQSARLPILHVPYAKSYDPLALATKIRSMIS